MIVIIYIIYLIYTINLRIYWWEIKKFLYYINTKEFFGFYANAYANVSRFRYRSSFWISIYDKHISFQIKRPSFLLSIGEQYTSQNSKTRNKCFSSITSIFERQSFLNSQRFNYSPNFNCNFASISKQKAEVVTRFVSFTNIKE